MALMEQIAPARLAQPWDNVGLQVGSPAWPVRTIRVALDPALDVIAAACRDRVDLVITHHPLIFKPLKRIDPASEQGAVIREAVTHQTAVFSAHTNLDAAVGGVNEVLACRLGIEHVRPLVSGEPSGVRSPADETQGLGRIGDLKSPQLLTDFARRVKTRLGLAHVRVSGSPELDVKRVAVCSGSGSGLLEDFLVSDAQVYVSGDLHYHNARDTVAAGRALIDVGHFASEVVVVDALAKRLQEACSQAGLAVTVQACRLERDPFRTM